MSEKELQYIKNFLATAKMTDAVKNAIKNCLHENEKLKIERDILLSERKALLNRCKALTDCTLCMFCGFRRECFEHDT